MKKTKIAAALMIMTAGSVMLAGNPAAAETVRYRHDPTRLPHEYREPPHHGPHHLPPPPHEWRESPHHEPHHPPPPPHEWRESPHHGPHNPPPPHHHGPHNPPPPHHRGPHGRDIGVEPRW